MNNRKRIRIYSVVGVAILVCIVAILLKTCRYNQIGVYQNNSENSNIAASQKSDDIKEVFAIDAYENDISKNQTKNVDVSKEITVANSDVSKVEIGIADDTGFDAPMEPEGLAFDTSSGKTINSSSKSSYSKSQPTETGLTVPAETLAAEPGSKEPESQPAISESKEPESESKRPEPTEPETYESEISKPDITESQTGETLPVEVGTEDEIETVPEDILILKNGVQDYDDYEALTSAERKQIRKTFASVKDYNDWLTGLVEKRNNKIREGAIGYGEEAIAD